MRVDDQSWILPSGMFNIRCLKLNNTYTYTHLILLRFYFYFILSKWSRYFHHTFIIPVNEFILFSHLFFTFIFLIYFSHILAWFYFLFVHSLVQFIHSFISTFISSMFNVQPSNWQHEKRFSFSVLINSNQNGNGKSKSHCTVCKV